MKFFIQGTAQDFQHEVAALLGLEPSSSDAAVRQALFFKGSEYLAWYDGRMRAISAASEMPGRPADSEVRTTKTAR